MPSPVKRNTRVERNVSKVKAKVQRSASWAIQRPIPQRNAIAVPESELETSSDDSGNGSAPVTPPAGSLQTRIPHLVRLRAGLTRQASLRSSDLPTRGQSRVSRLINENRAGNPAVELQRCPSFNRAIASFQDDPDSRSKGVLQYVLSRLPKKLEDLPSNLIQQSNSNFTSWNWERKLRQIASDKETYETPTAYVLHLDTVYRHLCKASALVEQIRLCFQYGILDDDDDNAKSIDFNRLADIYGICRTGRRGRNVCTTATLDYAGEIFNNQIKLQDRYDKWTKKALIDVAECKQRKRVVQWIIQTATSLSYWSETIHLAVHLVDAYLSKHDSKLRNDTWMLLGVTALHIAGKLEEPIPCSIEYLIRECETGPLPIKDCKWMEKIILFALGFNVNPPLAPLLVQIVIWAGGLDFPSDSLKLITMDLANAILFKSLLNHRLFTFPPAQQAKLALEVATEFVFYNYPTYATRTEVVYDSSKQPGNLVGDWAYNLCADVFQERLKQMKSAAKATVSHANE